MDGLPGMRRALEAGKKEKVAPIKKMVGPLAPTRYNYQQGFTAQQVLLFVVLAFVIGLLTAVYGPTVLQHAKKIDVQRLKSLVNSQSF
jgi:hypothetical protein